MAETIFRFCEQENCPLQSEGKCLEGFNPVDQCPHIKASPVNISEKATERDSVAEDEEDVAEAQMPIPYGDDLTEASCRRIMGSQLTHLIVLAGEPESGKTTLITSIYDSFQRGPLAGYIFAGSQTLPGFERRSHPSRIASGRSFPETDRTREMKILHLQVKRQSASDSMPQHLLLCDISGEDFKAARNSIEDARRLRVVRRADYFLLLLDGEHLIDPSKRHKVMENGRMLLLSLLDAQMLGDWSLVDILFNKNDVLEAHDDQTRLEQFLQNLTHSFTQHFAQRLSRLRFHRIAARPPRPVTMKKATAVDLLFPSWVEESSQFSTKPKMTTTPSMTTGREFDLFLERALLQLAPGGRR